MILLISTCKEKIHEEEFVYSIKKVLKDSFVRHYKELQKEDLEKADKVIICGTALKDDEYLENLGRFSWLKDFEKPVLGICSGMQIIGLQFGSKVENNQEIGYYKESFEKEFLGLKEEVEVYHLHNNYVTLPNNFEKYAGKEIPQAIKHKRKEIYGVLFHPEVRNQVVFEEFERV